MGIKSAVSQWVRDSKHCSLAALHRLYCCTRLCTRSLRVVPRSVLLVALVTSVSPAFAENPSDYFDFKFWKLTLPLDANQDGKVDEISVRGLSDYVHPEFFSPRRATKPDLYGA